MLPPAILPFCFDCALFCSSHFDLQFCEVSKKPTIANGIVCTREILSKISNPLLQYLSCHLLCDFLHDRKILIIRSEFIDDLLFAEGALMENDEAFVFAILKS